MTQMDRRNFVRSTAVGTLAFQVAGVTTWLTPREAHAGAVAIQHFSAEQQTLLGGVCEHLLPGAIEAGVVEFVDQQLGETPNECMLMCKFFPGLNAPYNLFYVGGLSALESLTQKLYSKSFPALNSAQKDSVVKSIWEGTADPWQGPPPPLFYMMLRSDAVDVVYGTEAGFQELGVPYLAHIRPPQDWAKQSNAFNQTVSGGKHG
ncbi:MAG: gluconate 2-dehydrogenase subunit 3 family protein [Gammaproteobacteria bacterium]